MPGIDLSDKGIEQAEAAADRLSALTISTVYASPIERTTQTATYIAKAVRARSATTSRCDRKPTTATGPAARSPTSPRPTNGKSCRPAPSRAVFPGGESLRAMQSRMIDALDAVVAAHPHETVVVVSHADPIKSAIAHYTGMHLDLFQRLHVSPASVTVFDFHAYGALLVKCNDTGGLAISFPSRRPPDRAEGLRDRAEKQS